MTDIILARTSSNDVQIIQRGGWLLAMIGGEHCDTWLTTEEMQRLGTKGSRDTARAFLKFIIEEE